MHFRINCRRCFSRIFFYIALFISSSGICNAAEVVVSDLQCDGLFNPVGSDNPNPKFSWKLQSAERNYTQKAYRIIVASSKEKLNSKDADLWNSGRIVSAQSLFINYTGKKLSSNNKYYWKVFIWGNKDRDSAESKTSYWITGLMNEDEWKAKWIGLDSSFSWDNPTNFHSKLSARYFRKQFSAKSNIKKATAHLVGLGLYELYVNGNRIGNQVLAPTATDYTKTVYYNTFDFTTVLVGNDNTIGIVLGNGRFFSMRPGKAGVWKEDIPTSTNFGYPKLLFQLEIEYEDETKEMIISDSTWKVTADGPIRSNNEYDGETYDAAKEMKGWAVNSFDDMKWLSVDMTIAPGGKVRWQPNPNMEIMETLEPVSITKRKQNSFIADMGQNIVGWISMQVNGAKGDTVRIRFAERLNDDGSLYTANLRNAEVIDKYILKGTNSGEQWQPSFVYHGFRFVEISGIDSLHSPKIQGRVIYDKMETTGTFDCSNLVLNQIHKNAWWTISGNYKGMPVDCPQRDERMGWLGDRSINSFGESFLLNNYHVYTKWLDDIKDAQLESGSIPDVAPSYWWRFFSDNMTWPSTYLFVTDMIYSQFGDKEIVRKHYPNMKKWMTYMTRYLSPDSLLTKDSYGDWCMPPESKELIHSQDSTRKTPGDFLASTYYFHCLNMMAKFADLSGKNDDKKLYLDFADRMLISINSKYLNKVSPYYANNTTTANLLALAFSIAPENARQAVVKNIVVKTKEKFNDHLSTGLVGNQWLMRGLSNNGFPELAFKIATNTTYPSWGYMIKNDATTIWELWNGNTANPAMNSGNHVMLLGDLLIWYYENLAGIKSIEPGFKKIEMKPFFSANLSYVNASHTSPYGKISSNYLKKEKEILWSVTIPANSSAILYFPSLTMNRITESGKSVNRNSGIRFVKQRLEYSIFEVGSGTYQFSFPR